MCGPSATGMTMQLQQKEGDRTLLGRCRIERNTTCYINKMQAERMFT